MPELTTEQSLNLRLYADTVAHMDEAEAKARLVQIYETMMRMDNAYKARLKKDWGIG